MQALVVVDPSALQQSALLAMLVRTWLTSLVAVDRVEIRARLVPPLYESGVVFKREPPGVETFVDAVTCYRQGHGDCAHLGCWRAAELLELGKPAAIFIRWGDPDPKTGRRLFHVSVRHGVAGPVEDVSRNLGMGRVPRKVG